MGVNAHTDIDFMVIGAQMGMTAMPWMNAVVQIVDTNLRDVEWDEWTNEASNDPAEILWEGRARIQHLGGTQTPDVGFSPDGVKMVRVQVPLDLDAGFIRKGLQVRVLSGGNDYALDGAVMTVVSAVNSSYAWLRTIMCEWDVKNEVSDGGL